MGRQISTDKIEVRESIAGREELLMLVYFR